VTAERAAGAQTFLIADIRGYTSYTAEHGDDAAATLANRFAALTREVVEAHEGFVIELRGDEALCAFVSARQALRAALALQERYRSEELARGVGIGIDSGEAIPVEGGYRGTALNLAARLCAQAKGGQIIASEGVIHLAARVDGVAYVEPRTLRLKGYDDPIRAVDVVSASDVRGRRTSSRSRSLIDRRLLAGGAVAVVVLALGTAVLSGAFSPRSSPESVPPTNPAVALGSPARSPGASPPLATNSQSATPGSSVPGSPAASPLASDGPLATESLPLLAYLDPETGAISATQAAPSALSDESVFVDGAFWQLALNPTAFYRIDPESRAVTATVPLPPNVTGRDTIDSGTIWLTDGGHARLYGIDGNTGAQIHDFTLYDNADEDSRSAGVAVGDGSVWVALNDAQQVLRVDPASGAIKARIDVRDAYNTAFGNGALWVTGNGRISRVDPATNEVTFSTLLHQFHTLPFMTFSSDAVWTADEADGKVYKVDRAGNIVATYDTGAGARPLQYMSGNVWVANQDAGTVSAIDANTGAVQTFNVGHQVTNLAAGGGTVLIGVDRSPEDVLGALKGQVLTVAMNSDVLQIPAPDPATNPYPYNRMILYATCSRLLDYGDVGGDEAYQLHPEVAASMPEVSPDGLTYTFTVKPGFGFSPSSSEQLTAETFRFSMERALSPALGHDGRRAIDVWSDIAGASEFNGGKADHVSGIEADGDKLTITLTTPAQDFLGRLALSYSCPVPLGTPAVPSLDPNTPVPSSGPYYLASHAGGEYAILERNPNYGGARRGAYDSIALRFGLAEGETAAWVDDGRASMAINDTVLQAGSDLARQWGADGPHAAAGDQRWYEIAYPGTDYLLLNPHGQLTRDETVRRAVALALDRTAAAESFLEPGGTTLLDEALRVRDEPVAELLGPNDDDARALLAGRVGTIRVAIPKDCDQCVDSANSIKSNLAAIGLTVEVIEEDDPIAAADNAKQKIDIVANYAQAQFPDAASVVNLVVNTAPKGWFDADQVAAADSLLQLSGDDRDRQAAAVAQTLTASAAVVPYGVPADGVYFGPSVGCRTIIAGIMNVDLAALCPAAAQK